VTVEACQSHGSVFLILIAQLLWTILRQFKVIASVSECPACRPLQVNSTTFDVDSRDMFLVTTISRNKPIAALTAGLSRPRT